ncbi:MAG: Hemerythrin cation binding protein [Deltaproteobacteria bacterium]|nr:Hemerythrin cation binding protein [Deltaproteobacteria bacterium]
MADVAHYIIDEHRNLLPHIEELRIVADSVGDFSPSLLLRGIDKLHDFLMSQLIPHAQAEEETFYPAVAKILGTPQAIATMSRDHAEVSDLTGQLRALRSQISHSGFDEDKAKELRRILYGLHTLLKAHFAKEEEVYLPMLDTGLDEIEAHDLFHKMAEISHGETSHLHH